jgi:sterol desaturase/sphingolipid hydroxylase (fatty acid hydroxylase superfamily)
MPTPLDILLDPISLIILAIYGSLMLWEAVFPGRKLPHVKHWKLRGLLAFVFYFYLSSYLPIFINPILETYRLMDLTGLGALGGGIFAILLYEFGVFAWHYCLHRSDFLWKTSHQMHHSAERLDTYGAFYFSPFDMIGWTVLGSICFSLIAGLSPQAITIMLLTTNFFSIFQHANIRTPQWLGYFIQRPESHALHHAKGIHQYNYSDLPLFDILFGTFRNPRDFAPQTGFYPGASSRLWDMVRGKDVSTPEPDKQVVDLQERLANR